jgi:hypothetical protein
MDSLGGFRCRRNSQAELIELVASLSPEQQNAVETFIRYMREKNAGHSDVQTALNEFVRDHSELLRRLAQ